MISCYFPMSKPSISLRGFIWNLADSFCFELLEFELMSFFLCALSIQRIFHCAFRLFLKFFEPEDFCFFGGILPQFLYGSFGLSRLRGAPLWTRFIESSITTNHWTVASSFIFLCHIFCLRQWLRPSYFGCGCGVASPLIFFFSMDMDFYVLTKVSYPSPSRLSPGKPFPPLDPSCRSSPRPPRNKQEEERGRN